MSPFGAHIRIVVVTASKEQMIRVHAGADIASMQNAQP